VLIRFDNNQENCMSAKNKYMIDYRKAGWPQRTRGPLTRAGAIWWLAKSARENTPIKKIRYHNRIVTPKHYEDLFSAAKLWDQIEKAETA
jgi:hypothetical protein